MPVAGAHHGLHGDGQARLEPRAGAGGRTFEEHGERPWAEEQLRRLLAEAGFARVTFTGDLTQRPPKADEDRWIVQADKK